MHVHGFAAGLLLLSASAVVMALPGVRPRQTTEDLGLPSGDSEAFLNDLQDMGVLDSVDPDVVASYKAGMTRGFQTAMAGGNNVDDNNNPFVPPNAKLRLRRRDQVPDSDPLQVNNEDGSSFTTVGTRGGKANGSSLPGKPHSIEGAYLAGLTVGMCYGDERHQWEIQNHRTLTKQLAQQYMAGWMTTCQHKAQDLLKNSDVYRRLERTGTQTAPTGQQAQPISTDQNLSPQGIDDTTGIGI